MRKNAWLGLLSSFLAASIAVSACGDTEQEPTGGTGPTTTTIGGAGGTTAMGGMAGMAGHMTGGGGTGGATGGGGAGGSPECGVPSDCGISDDCHGFTCTEGVCGETFAAMGTKTQSQAIGDCKTNVCDGQGGIVPSDDATDVFDDLNDCTDDACVAGAPANDAKVIGTACASNGGAFCDGAKACVECILGGDCPTGVCAADHTCAPAQCGDGVKNGSETDIDCGGAACGKCMTSLACLVGTDCIDAVCDPGTKTCSASSCSDSVKNGSETDVDCGGPCPDCVSGQGCGSPADCTTGVCSGNPLKCQSATCMDGVKNGNETDADCGGPVCADCVNGKLCSVAGDCVSQVCSGNPKTCQIPSCMDGAKNGNETGQDCGGGTCGACPVGQGCTGNSDCLSGFCNGASVCATPNCMDGAKNGAETDVDCGGPTCPDCADNKVCLGASDCLGGFCLGPPVCQSALNGCTLATAQDHTAEAVTTVTQQGLTYSPQCIKIKAGKQVKIDASYAGHPLTQGPVVNGVAYPEMGGPITHTASGTTATFTFPTAGAFGYYCDFHYGFGMYGAVFVVP